MARNIILLLDGTWNDADLGPCDTNIVRLRDRIAKHLQRQTTSQPKALLNHRELVETIEGVPNINPTSIPSSPEPNDGPLQPMRLVSGYRYANKETLVFYERGVGTGAADRLWGGAFGHGLSGNIRRAYKFLSFWYEPGDEIFIFGFSRGAYTARSLIGYIFSAGLLKREACTQCNEEQAWGFYRTDPNDRLPGVWTNLTPLVHDRSTFKIALVGVFDTVGALGIPVRFAFRFNRARYGFHAVDLSSITKVNLQALAIDEHRSPFEASLWRKPKFKQFATQTEQVWFPGAHCDIGGGYIHEENRAGEGFRALDDITLEWMINRVLRFYPDFPCDGLPDGIQNSDLALAPQHESRQGQFRLWPFAWRAIANRNMPLRRWRREKLVSRDRHAEPIAEMVHISALERLGKKITVDNHTITYQPRNLLAALPVIENTYSKNKNPNVSPDILVVDWNGEPLSFADPETQRRIINLLSHCGGR